MPGLGLGLSLDLPMIVPGPKPVLGASVFLRQEALARAWAYAHLLGQAWTH